mgnify:FL=1
MEPNRRNSLETKRNYSETKQDESSKYLIDYLLREQKKRDHEIAKLKKDIQTLKKELQIYTNFLNENMGYR